MGRKSGSTTPRRTLRNRTRSLPGTANSRPPASNPTPAAREIHSWRSVDPSTVQTVPDSTFPSTRSLPMGVVSIREIDSSGLGSNGGTTRTIPRSATCPEPSATLATNGKLPASRATP